MLDIKPMNEQAKAQYADRRQQVIEALGEDGIAFFPAAREALRNGDVHYPYRQDSDFYYLSGFSEPNAILVLMATEPFFILFNQRRDSKHEIWTGPRLGQEQAMEYCGAQEAYPIDSFEEKLPALLRGKRRVLFPIGRYKFFDRMIMQGLERARAQFRLAPRALGDSSEIVHPLRLIKSDYEVQLMRKAAHISAVAHKRAMRVCRDCQYEYEVDAEITYEMFRLGCEYVAYQSIVASGENTCILHYTDNRSRLGEQDLLLIDAGGEYGGYAADITRTFPVNGRFNAQQRVLYEWVLRAQQAGIEVVRPGAPWTAIQQAMVKVMSEALLDLGVLQGSLEEVIENKLYEPFYMHSSGHWLGLDVHDVGDYTCKGQATTLQPGMVLTVEPGFYMSSEQVTQPWAGMGIRIEDDVLVTPQGCEVLSKEVPKAIDDIETLMTA